MPEPDHEVPAALDPGGDFPRRLAADRAELDRLYARLWLVTPGERQQRLGQIEKLAHRLAGAAGTFGFTAIGEAALGLEEVLIEQREGLLAGEPAIIEARLAALAALLR